VGEGVNSRKRRGEFNSRELARDEIAARRLVAGDLGHNYLNARGWINCCISHAKLILIRHPPSPPLPRASRLLASAASEMESVIDHFAPTSPIMHAYSRTGTLIVPSLPEYRYRPR